MYGQTTRVPVRRATVSELYKKFIYKSPNKCEE